MTLHHWLRFVCDRPAPQGFTSWLGTEAAAVWESMTSPYALVEGAPTWVGVDMARTRDTSAVVSIQQRPDGKYHAFCRIWTPRPDAPIDATDVMEYLRGLDRGYDLRAVSYDPRSFDVPASFLEDEGLPMIEIPQSIERMTPAVGDTFAAIRSGRITHDGMDAFTTQVLNAVPRFNERGFTLSKPKSRGTPFTDRGFEHIPVLEHLQAWLTDLMVA